MKRMILVVFALASVTACVPDTTAAPATVTQTVTDTNTATKPAGDDEPAGEKLDDKGATPADGTLPCTSLHMEAEMAPGEGPGPELWHTALVVTNLGPDRCSLEGVSEVRFYTGGDGSLLPVEFVVWDEGPPAEKVVLAVGDQANTAMLLPVSHDPDPAPECLLGGLLVDVFLPGDEDPVSTQADIPAICGEVKVSPWGAGGAPGVPPN